MQHNTCISTNRSSKALLNRAQLLVLIVLSSVMLTASMSAQSLVAANTTTGKILGTVVDTTDDPIPGATVVLQGLRATVLRL
jgi:hypothetical protein